MANRKCLFRSERSECMGIITQTETGRIDTELLSPEIWKKLTENPYVTNPTTIP